MAVTEITNQSWLSRILESIKGVLVGLVMLVISFPLLFWNEGRAVKTAKSLSEGAGAVKTVQVDKVDAANEKALVHVTGTSKTDEQLTDPDFAAVNVNAIKLSRSVEMYQWVEKKKSKEEKKLGGGTRTVTTYDYEKKWEDSVVDSSDFKEEGHTNPTGMPYDDTTLVAKHVTLGAFTLSPEQISQLDSSEPLVADAAATKGVEGAKISKGTVYLGANAESPAIGDVRVSWKVVRPGPVSVVGVQTGNSFSAYQASAGDSILLVKQSTLTAAQMFQAAQDENATMTWILRAVGWFLSFMGLLLIFKPISVLADVVPFIGSIMGAGLGVFAFLASSILALVTIAISWIVVRPLLGIGLLVLAGGAVAAIVVTGRKRKAAQSQPA